ncbi:MAG: hypothetical protein QF731_02000, partial [Verrucomicrobiota bacterium]|nr:hypothetical protein [Verrucomicrobiota bacterium]
MKFEKKITLTILIAIFACQNQSTCADDPKIIAKPITQANITGTEPGWRPMTKDDFVNVNCSDDTWSFESNLIKCTGKPVGVIRTKKMVKNHHFSRKKIILNKIPQKVPKLMYFGALCWFWSEMSIL